MLGYLLEYFYSSSIPLNIYAHNILIESKEWNEYYSKLFKREIIWYVPTLFNPENYDLIILLTDDDINFKEEWLEQYGPKKIVMIDHHCTIRRNHAMFRIGTRFFSNRPNCKWALPCYNVIKKHTKEELLSNEDRIHVICIGIQNRPSIEFLQILFEDFDKIEFHVIARTLDYDYDLPNIHTYLNCSTIKMFELLSIARYVLCIENPNNLNPQCNSISGAIPLSFNFGCQLILPITWQRFYNFKSIITYNDPIFQNNGITKIKLEKDIPLDIIYNELYDLVSHKNKVLDELINININFSDNWLCKLFNILGLKKLHVLIITSQNENPIDLNINDFREIHYIENNYNNYNDYSLKYKNDMNINLYHNEVNIIKKLNYKIKEPVIFYLNLNKNIYYELSQIGKRHHNDIVIINNCDENNINAKKIIQSYNRLCLYYFCSDINRMVIIPQI